MNKSQKALQAVLVEGVTPAEAAKRYGISTAAISKAKHHPSKKQLHAAELDQLRAQLAEAQAEIERLKEMAMFFSTYTDPDELEMDEIENAARESFRRANSGVRGTTITRSNSYESHVIWATKARINKEVTAARTALAAAEAREDNLMSSMEVAASALIQLKDSFAERGARPTTKEKLKLWNLAFSAYENLFEVFNQTRNESLLAKKNLRSN